MTDEQFQSISNHLQKISTNQVILENRIIAIQTELNHVISNQRLSGNEHDMILGDLKKIKRKFDL